MADQDEVDKRAEVRNLAKRLVEEVPGQLFRDVARFHEKFELVPEGDPEHRLPDDVQGFRLNFLTEELAEYEEAIGYDKYNSGDFDPKRFNAAKAFDALIDLVYVALGTAYLHGFPFNEGWDRVQEANMKKVRCECADDPRSTRKHRIDVVKPEGWKPPMLADLL